MIALQFLSVNLSGRATGPSHPDLSCFESVAVSAECRHRRASRCVFSLRDAASFCIQPHQQFGHREAALYESLAGLRSDTVRAPGDLPSDLPTLGFIICVTVEHC